MTQSKGIYAKRGTGPAFFRKGIERDTDECILWPYHRGSHGYGVTTLEPGKQVCVHVAACEMAHGPQPPDHEVAHSCGVRLCFNPKHLRWATRLENMRDAREARWPNGRPGPKTQRSNHSE